MAATSDPETLLSLNSLSRKLDITYARALELRTRGVFTPDFVADRIILFRKSRLPELRKTLIQL